MYLCGAYTDIGTATGGGIYAVGGLTLKYCVLEQNVANGGASGFGVGGGATSKGPFLGNLVTISGNRATGSGGNQNGSAGGLYLRNNATIVSSTISGNTAGRNIGGVEIANTSNTASLTAIITNSTISGNEAGDVVGGLYTNLGTVKIRNSTIAFNTAGSGTISNPPYGYNYFAPGLSLSASYAPIAVNMQSTLISNNTYGSLENDLSVGYEYFPKVVTFAAAPANNFVRYADATAQPLLPADTIQYACPLLGPLRDNGGATQTHALLSTSPAIDMGNNVAALNEDQRGLFDDVAPYPYPRQSGSAVDIGAYEVQKDDIIFNSGLEGCP